MFSSHQIRRPVKRCHRLSFAKMPNFNFVSLPQVIQDKTDSLRYRRVYFLGEVRIYLSRPHLVLTYLTSQGRFARVYQVRDSRNTYLACKFITKSSLKLKQRCVHGMFRLFLMLEQFSFTPEIKIRKALDHPNIVRFIDYFEDEVNAYMILELCPSGSLMNMHHYRHIYGTRGPIFHGSKYWCLPIHVHPPGHPRDLILDVDMNIKFGDFGLASLIKSLCGRKEIICSTPNYIAPEVLFDTANGHGFEVDTWSIDVALYTFVVGRPPFQTKDVKELYW